MSDGAGKTISNYYRGDLMNIAQLEEILEKIRIAFYKLEAIPLKDKDYLWREIRRFRDIINAEIDFNIRVEELERE